MKRDLKMNQNEKKQLKEALNVSLDNQFKELKKINEEIEKIKEEIK